MLGHVIGTGTSKAATKFLENKPEGRRKVARDQRLRWLDDTENYSQQLKVTRQRLKSGSE
jgi:hypothetical protein